jgi:flagellar basal body-associated protein FliL
VVPLGIAIPVLSRSETPSSDGSGSTAALIAVAGFAMILATAGLIFVVVRRRPDASDKSAPTAPSAEASAETSVEETDAATR